MNTAFHEQLDDFIVKSLPELQSDEYIYVVFTGRSVSWDVRFPKTRAFLADHIHWHLGAGIVGLTFRTKKTRARGTIEFWGSERKYFPHSQRAIYFMEGGTAHETKDILLRHRQEQMFLQCSKQSCETKREQLFLVCPSCALDEQKVQLVAMNERIGCPLHILPSSMVRDLCSLL